MRNPLGEEQGGWQVLVGWRAAAGCRESRTQETQSKGLQGVEGQPHHQAQPHRLPRAWQKRKTQALDDKLLKMS